MIVNVIISIVTLIFFVSFLSVIAREFVELTNIVIDQIKTGKLAG